MRCRGFASFALLVLFASSVSASVVRPLGLRLVLSEEEAKTAPHEVLPYRHGAINTEVTVGMDSILSNFDVESVTVALPPEILASIPASSLKEAPDGRKRLLASADGSLDMPVDPRIRITLNANGKQKLADFTTRNLQKKAAVTGNGRVLSRVLIIAPVGSGVMRVTLPVDNLNQMIRFINDMGLELEAVPQAPEPVV